MTLARLLNSPALLLPTEPPILFACHRVCPFRPTSDRVAAETPNQATASKQQPLFLCHVASRRYARPGFFPTRIHQPQQRKQCTDINQEKPLAGIPLSSPHLYPFPAGYLLSSHGRKEGIHAFTRPHAQRPAICPCTAASDHQPALLA